MAKMFLSLTLFITFSAALPVPKSPELWGNGVERTFPTHPRGVCKTQADCMTSLVCNDVNEYAVCKKTSTFCRCTPPFPQKCNSDTDCNASEKCEEK